MVNGLMVVDGNKFGEKIYEVWDEYSRIFYMRN